MRIVSTFCDFHPVGLPHTEQSKETHRSHSVWNQLELHLHIETLQCLLEEIKSSMICETSIISEAGSREEMQRTFCCIFPPWISRLLALILIGSARWKRRSMMWKRTERLRFIFSRCPPCVKSHNNEAQRTFNRLYIGHIFQSHYTLQTSLHSSVFLSKE